MKLRSYSSAVERRQAGRKDRHEKRPGAFEHTRPFVVTGYSPASKDQQPCIA
jgi:hypothetical protein